MGCGGWWDGWSLEGRGIERDEGGTERDGVGGGGTVCDFASTAACSYERQFH